MSPDGMSTLMFKNVSRLFAICMAIVFVSFAGPKTALAHNTLISSNPADGQNLPTPPTQWVLTFDKSVPLQSASAEVVDNTGVRTALPSPRHGETDNIVIFTFPTSLTDSNTARWRLIGTDGHVISGRVTFSIGTDAPTGGATNTPVNVETQSDGESIITSTSRPVLRLINYLGLLLLIGVLVSDKFLLFGNVAPHVNSRIATIAGQSLGATAFLQFLMFLNDARLPASGLWGGTFDVLTTTPGAMSATKALAGGVLAVLLSQRMDKTVQLERLVTISLVLFLITFAYGGHSRSEGAPWLGIPANIIHTSAISVWLGGLAILVCVVAPRLSTSDALRAFGQFGRMAERAVAILAITGIVQLLRMYPNPLSMFSSGHGLLLLVKVLIVGGMIYLAARNRRSLFASTDGDARGERTSRRLIVKLSLVEMGFGLVVLGVTGVLVGVSPT
jgi:copper transport protein